MKNVYAVALTSFALASCASINSTVKSDLMFSTENISNLNDTRITPVAVKEVELPSIYRTNGKYAICNVSFNLPEPLRSQSPKNVEISSCNTNDETGLLEEKCKTHFSEWVFSLQGKSIPEERYNAVCALKAKKI
jgi:hypothetical protein